MKAAQVPKPGAEFHIIEREIPTLGARRVRIKVLACGVYQGDLYDPSRLMAIRAHKPTHPPEEQTARRH